MSVDPKGLEAAWQALSPELRDTREMDGTNLRRAIEAYLAATSPAGDLAATLEAVLAEHDADRADEAANAVDQGERPDLWEDEITIATHLIREAAQALRYQSTGVTEITDEMVERAARAICRHVPIDGSSAWNEPYGYDFDADYSDKERMIIRNIARAALSDGGRNG